MTGFENTANVAEETIDPHKAFPRSLIGGMLVAGVIYVLVSMAAALTVADRQAGRVRRGAARGREGGHPAVLRGLDDHAVHDHRADRDHQHHPGRVVTQPRILYGMANEDVVPGVFAKIHPTRRSPWVGLLFSGVVVCALLVIGTLLTEAGAGLDLVARLAAVTVVFLLFIYALVIVACLKLRGQDEDERTFRANTPLLVVGLVGNLAILYWSIYDDPTLAALVRRPGRPSACVLYVVEKFFGARNRRRAAPVTPTRDVKGI